MKNVKQTEFYRAEVGSPLQKALVDNFEAQKQLCEVIDLAIAERDRQVVEMIEIYQPVEIGGEAIREDGSHLEKIAIIVGGKPIFLKDGICLEKTELSKEKVNNLINSKK